MLIRTMYCLVRCLGRAARSLVLLAWVAGGLVAAVPATAAELVMFEEAGCVWCQRWDREVSEAYAHSEEGRMAPLRRVDISEARRSGVQLVSPVNVTPTFVLVDAGREVGRITGYPGADFFWGLLDQMMGRLRAPALRAPPLQRTRGAGAFGPGRAPREAHGVGRVRTHVASALPAPRCFAVAERQHPNRGAAGRHV